MENFVPQPINTPNGLDLVYLAMGVVMTRQFIKSLLSRGNDKQGAGVNGSENRGKDWMGDGGHQATRDGGGCVVYRPGNDTVCRGRFGRRAKSLEHQRRTQADRIVTQCVSPSRRALREYWATAVKHATAEVATNRTTTGTTTGLAGHAGTLKEGCFDNETVTPAGKKSAAPRERSSQDRKTT